MPLWPFRNIQSFKASAAGAAGLGLAAAENKYRLITRAYSAIGDAIAGALNIHDIELDGTALINKGAAVGYEADRIANDIFRFYESRNIDPGYIKYDLIGAMGRKLKEEYGYSGQTSGIEKLPVPKDYAEHINRTD